MATGTGACDVLCNNRDHDELNLLCACALVDVGRLHESLRLCGLGTTKCARITGLAALTASMRIHQVQVIFSK